VRGNEKRPATDRDDENSLSIAHRCLEGDKLLGVAVGGRDRRNGIFCRNLSSNTDIQVENSNMVTKKEHLIKIGEEMFDHNSQMSRKGEGQTRD